MGLTQKQIKQLKGLAHHLDPVVIVGKGGLSESVTKEIDHCLEAHELIKIRVTGEDRTGMMAVFDQIVDLTDADLVQVIGHLGVFYRPSQEPTIELV